MKFHREGLTKFFNSTTTSSFGETAKTVVTLAKSLPAGSRVLDLGCGDGRNALFLAENGFNVTGVDLSEAGIEKLQRLATERGVNVETQVADLATYSIQTDYDAILAQLVFQFLSEKDSLRLLGKMKAHTKPGGFHVVHLMTQTGDRKTLDRKEDPESNCFYPADGWIKDYYSDWELVWFLSTSGPLIGKFHEDGSPMTNVVERIVVKKPGR